MTNVFIDGKEGTTGLKIYERLGGRADVNILTVPEEERKDIGARAARINAADIVFLCLPDQPARESSALCTNHTTKIIDASTSHRTDPVWAYGFPELSMAHRKRIENSYRTAVPGCHASGFISLVYPLVAGGFAGSDYPFSCHSVTGYSGGGKKMIAAYESESRGEEYESPRQYGLGQTHKHLPEMQKVCGLSEAPVFSPIVAPFYRGMCVTVPVHTRLLKRKTTPDDLRKYFADFYEGQYFVSVKEDVPSFLPANTLNGTNKMEIYVSGTEDRIVLSSVFDNLGKGASGAAVQCMNIMLGLDERTSLE